MNVTYTEHAHHNEPPIHGWKRWLFTTNHKDIGVLYLVFGMTMFLVGGLFAMLIRAELFQPTMSVLSPEAYNQVVTLHGLVMVFAALMPVTTGFANYF
ncbi:MAG: cbb3-type cytochrome c oxidase subunit I, partial [Acidobacteriaceae bacterium]